MAKSSAKDSKQQRPQPTLDMKEYHKPRNGADLFALPASDAKGDSVTLTVKMPPMYAAIIDKILLGQKTPFRSKSDLLRYAIAVTVDHYGRGDVAVESMNVQLNVINGIIQDGKFQLEFMEMFGDIMKLRMELVGRGMGNEAYKMLLKVRRGIEDMPDSALRDRYLQEFDRQHGDITTHAQMPEL